MGIALVIFVYTLTFFKTITHVEILDTPHLPVYTSWHRNESSVSKEHDCKRNYTDFVACNVLPPWGRAEGKVGAEQFFRRWRFPDCQHVLLVDVCLTNC
jgi:hypothetical protein